MRTAFYISFIGTREMEMSTFTLYWVREDKQGDYNMGEFSTREAAEAAIPAAKQELLEMSGSEPWMTDEIELGTFHITEA